jgi:hypothetical protein
MSDFSSAKWSIEHDVGYIIEQFKKISLSYLNVSDASITIDDSQRNEGAFIKLTMNDGAILRASVSRNAFLEATEFEMRDFIQLALTENNYSTDSSADAYYRK